METNLLNEIKNRSGRLLVTTLGIFFFVALTGCLKKDTELKAAQIGCEKLKIQTPTYNLLADPCDGGLNLTLDIKVSLSGSAECVHKVKNFPTFYNDEGVELTSTPGYPAELIAPDFVVDGNSLSFTFDVTFNNAQEASDFNYLVLKFHTEDEAGAPSDTMNLRINTKCTIVNPDSYNLSNQEVVISSFDSQFEVILWDDAAEDGDIVSLYINEEWLIDNHSLVNDSTFFYFSTDKLNSGNNHVVLFAVNEGSVGPNTVSMSINGTEVDIPSFQSGLLTGEAVNIKFQ